jgi:hypothetical protein
MVHGKFANPVLGRFMTVRTFGKTRDLHVLIVRYASCDDLSRIDRHFVDLKYGIRRSCIIFLFGILKNDRYREERKNKNAIGRRAK